MLKTFTTKLPIKTRKEYTRKIHLVMNIHLVVWEDCSGLELMARRSMEDYINRLI
jgi:hypothetical protein